MSSIDSPACIALTLRAEERLGFALEPAEKQIIRDLQDGTETSFESPPVVRSKVIQWLLLDEGCRKLLADVAFRLDNCTITGALDLRHASITCALSFKRTTFAGELQFSFAKLRSMILIGCSIGIMRLNDSHLEGVLRFLPHANGPTRLRRVDLQRVRSSSDIVFRAVRIGDDEGETEGESGPVCDLLRASIAGSLYFVDGTVIRGELCADECRIAGDVNGIGSVTYSRTRHGAAVSFVRARIDGNVFLHSPSFARDPEAPAKEANFTLVYGVLRFPRVRIGGDLHLGGLHLNPGSASLPDEPPLETESAEDENRDTWWGLDLFAAKIEGSVWLPKMIAKDTALLFSHVSVGRHFECTGLYIDRTHKTVPSDKSQPRERASLGAKTVAGTEVVRADFEMHSAQVSERFSYDVLWKSKANALVDLTDTSVGSFHYASSQSLPDHLELVGLRFKRITSNYYEFRRKRLAGIANRFGWRAAEQPSGRLRAWLHEFVYLGDRTHLHLPRRHQRRHFEPALYDELATALDGLGRSEEAQRVRIAKINDWNRSRGVVAQIGGLPYRLFVANGLRPARAIVWAAVFIAIGSYIFQHAYQSGSLVPVDPKKIVQPFEPVVYSADVLLPIVDLHQESGFEAVGPGSRLVRLYLWFQIVVGWLIATALAAAVGSSLRKS